MANKKQGQKSQGQKKQGGRSAYTSGLYAIGEAFIRGTCKGIVTKSALVAHLATAIKAERKAVTEVPNRLKKLYKTVADYTSAEAINSAAIATATVLLSPREVGADQSKATKGQILSGTGRGDCRGNFSAKGELYFMTPLARNADKDGVKPEQRFRWNWRKEALAPHSRPVTEGQEVKATKAAKPVKVKTPAKAKAVKVVKAKAAKAAKPAKAKAKKVKATKVVEAKVEAPVAPVEAPAAPIEATVEG